MALFKLIKEFERILTELESKKPKTLLLKMIIDARITVVKSRIKELKNEAFIKKTQREPIQDYK